VEQILQRDLNTLEFYKEVSYGCIKNQQ